MPPGSLEKKKGEGVVISKAEVARIAELAHLSLGPREEERYSRELSAIVEYFRIIGRAELSNIAPMYHTTELTNVFRGEEVVPTDPAPILDGVPKRKGRLVRAPRVF